MPALLAGWTDFCGRINSSAMERGASRTDDVPASQTAAEEISVPSEMSAERYEALRRLAANYLRDERPGHTLQPTALVHEAFIRLLEQNKIPWSNEEHFTALAARAMRRILINYAIARTRQKRGGPAIVRLPLDEALDFCVERNLNLGAVDDALEQLQLIDERQARIVELRFFAGLTNEEIAAALDVSLATVKRDWTTAKIWLQAKLSLE